MKPIDDEPAIFLSCDDSLMLENLQMVGHHRNGRVQDRRDLADVFRATAQELNDSQPVRISKRLESVGAML